MNHFYFIRMNIFAITTHTLSIGGTTHNIMNSITNALCPFVLSFDFFPLSIGNVFSLVSFLIHQDLKAKEELLMDVSRFVLCEKMILCYLFPILHYTFKKSLFDKGY